MENEKFVDTFRHLNPKTVKYSYFNARSGAKQRNQGWRLDYFVVSESLINSVVNSEILVE